MKRAILFACILSVTFSLSWSQKVDSVRVEQSGDFIKIRYKMPDSRPGQVFRVRILYSVNGGLNTEIRSVTGDTGDQVAGGKSEYWAIWDVLKDVDEISSADFIVRAELVRDLSEVAGTGLVKPASKWDSKRFHAHLVLTGPGPKSGIRLGYMGSFGVSAQLSYGKIEKGDVSYVPDPSGALGIDITKRIVKTPNFNMHLLAGFHQSDLLFSNPVATATAEKYTIEGVNGVEAGTMFDFKRISFLLMLIHLDPGAVEQKNDSAKEAVSPLNYVNIGFGIRF